MTDRDRILKAVDRLAAALAELAYTDRVSVTPDIRMLLCPNEPTSTEGRHMHALGLTPELAELLAESIEQLIITRSVAEEPDPFNAYIFAIAKPELTAEIKSAFDGIDIDELTRMIQQEAEDNE